jgi:hypothetical protein
MGIEGRNMEDESIKLFFSYSHKDESFREDLTKHLVLLTREGVISTWHDGMIRPGDEWDTQIHGELMTADITLFLVSIDFISSDYWGTHLRRDTLIPQCFRLLKPRPPVTGMPCIVE